jgi:hypothetical protein
MSKLRSLKLAFSALFLSPSLIAGGLASTVAVAESLLPSCPDRNVVWTNCQGTQSYSDGDGGRYVGEFTNDKKNGQGTYSWTDGRRYDGQFRDGKLDGQGTHTWPNGDKYVGEFKNDQPNGRGTYTFANGDILSGQFRDGINGQGTLTSPNGAKYLGEFKSGLLTGQVASTSPRGDKFVGDFKEGHASGNGTIVFVNGAKYVGEFSDDKQSGRGTYTFANGDKYTGEFQDNQFNGQGIYISASDGSVTSGIWKNGKFTKSQGIPIEIEGGTFIVPVTINAKITLNFTIDSGASDVSVPADVVSTLIRLGSIERADFLGEQQYQLADGSIVPSPVFNIRSLKVGDKVVENVKGSVASVKGSLLLGQSFLNRFNSWSVDNRQRLLFLN